MSAHGEIQAFIWSCFAVKAQLSKTYFQLGIDRPKSELDSGSQDLIRPYVKQFSASNRNDAEYMAEHYTLFYMLENEIRDFVAAIMEDAKGDDWWSSDVLPDIQKRAEKNKTREISEGVSIRSSRPIDYTNFGELGEIIKSNWDAFGGIFSSSNKMAVEKVMARLSMLRNNIAHCSAFDEDEVLRLRLTIRDWFRLTE